MDGFSQWSVTSGHILGISETATDRDYTTSEGDWNAVVSAQMAHNKTVLEYCRIVSRRILQSKSSRTLGMFCKSYFVIAMMLSQTLMN